MLPPLEVPSSHANPYGQVARKRNGRDNKAPSMMMSPDGWNESTKHRHRIAAPLRAGAAGGSVARARQAALRESQSASVLEVQKTADSFRPATKLSPLAAAKLKGSSEQRSPGSLAKGSPAKSSPSKSPVRLTPKERMARKKYARHMLKHVVVVRVAAMMEARLQAKRHERAISILMRPASRPQTGGGSDKEKTNACLKTLHAANFGKWVQEWRKRRAAKIMHTFLTEFAHDVVGSDNSYGVGLHTIRLAIWRVKKVLVKVQRGIRSFVEINHARRKMLARKWADVYRKNLPRLSKFKAKLERDYKRRQQAPPETPWIAEQMKQMLTTQRRANKMLALHEKKKLKLMKRFAQKERNLLTKLEGGRDRTRSRADSNDSVASSVLLAGLDTTRSMTSLGSTAAHSLSSMTIQTTSMTRNTMTDFEASRVASYSMEALADLPFTNAQRDTVCAELLTNARQQFFLDCTMGSEKKKAEKLSALEKASGNAAYNIEDALKMVSVEGYLEEQLGMHKSVHLVDANKWPPFLALKQIGEREMLKRICKAMQEHFTATHREDVPVPRSSTGTIGMSDTHAKRAGQRIRAPWPVNAAA